MRVKIKVLPGKGRQSEFEITIQEAGMVEPIEAAGVRSLCRLVDKQDWDAARRRYDELNVKIRYFNNRPVVNIAEVKEASRRWHRKQLKRKTPH